MGGQPDGDPEDAVGERATERPAQVDPESPDWWDSQKGDVWTRDWTFLQGGSLRTDGEGHAHAGYSTR